MFCKYQDKSYFLKITVRCTNFIHDLFNTAIYDSKILWYEIFFVIIVIYSWDDFINLICFFYYRFRLEERLNVYSVSYIYFKFNLFPVSYVD